MNTSAPSSPTVPQRWAWHYHQLQSLLEHLLDQRSGHKAEACAPPEQHGTDMADCATDEFDHELALGLLSQEEDALFEIVSAIHRIIERRYGICEDTGKPIPEARLRAMPWARRTLEAQKRAELEGQTPGARLGRLTSLQGALETSLSDDTEGPDVEWPAGGEYDHHEREMDIRAITEGTAQV